MKNFILFTIFTLILTVSVFPQVAVSPNNVTAYSQGATSVYLTFSNVVNLTPAESVWCGEIISAAPNIGFRCDPATIFGSLPARYNQSVLTNNRYTDIMSVTPTVARRAYTDAVAGNDARFFYVRHFVSTNGGLDEYVPVGKRDLKLESTVGLRVGETIVVRRIGNQEWIREIGMDRITPRPTDPASTKQWQPFNLDFERVITKIDGNRLTLDAPIVCAIEPRWGGGEVYLVDKGKRISHIGIENLRGVSEFDKNITTEREDKKGKYYSTSK